jgi:hypothetical protein
LLILGLIPQSQISEMVPVHKLQIRKLGANPQIANRQTILEYKNRNNAIYLFIYIALCKKIFFKCIIIVGRCLYIAGIMNTFVNKLSHMVIVEATDLQLLLAKSYLFQIFSIYFWRRFIPSREYSTICRGPGFLAVIWFGSSPTPLPSSTSPGSKHYRRQTGRLRKRDSLLIWGRGRGGDGQGAWSSINHSILPDPLYIIQNDEHLLEVVYLLLEHPQFLHGSF